MKVLNAPNNTGQLKLVLLMLLGMLLRAPRHSVAKLSQACGRNVVYTSQRSRELFSHVNHTTGVRLDLAVEPPNLSLKGPDLGELKELNLDILMTCSRSSAAETMTELDLSSCILKRSFASFWPFMDLTELGLVLQECSGDGGE